MTVTWEAARVAAHAAGARQPARVVEVPLDEADGATLAGPLLTRTDLPAFPTSSVDGWATRGPAPWRIVGRVLAGTPARPLTESGTCVEIATGAMVPVGTEQIVRVEDSARTADGVTGRARSAREWREVGDEARAGEELFPAGTPVTPGLLGLAASCGYDTLAVRPPVRCAVLVFGDELLTPGLPGEGRGRDSLGPCLPAWLRPLAAQVTQPIGPGEDTLDAHVHALRTAIDQGAEPG